jgi:hypothetical protein
MLRVFIFSVHIERLVFGKKARENRKEYVCFSFPFGIAASEILLYIALALLARPLIAN